MHMHQATRYNCTLSAPSKSPLPLFYPGERNTATTVLVKQLSLHVVVSIEGFTVVSTL